MRMWAFWRRMIYGGAFGSIMIMILTGVYLTYLYAPSNCLDSAQNGSETGIDCGGDCVRMCTLDVVAPSVSWVRAFRAVEGMYNSVAYVENKNPQAGVERLGYTMKLYDSAGLITERKGVTPLPPGVLYPIFEGRIQVGGRIPTQTTIEFDAEQVWVPATVGQGQFRLLERTLEGADDMPVLKATVSNDALDEVKDVDVIATIYNSQGTPLTSSRTQVPLFPGRSTKDIAFTWQEPIAKTVRSCEVPTDVILGIDLSGSMNDDGGDPPEPVHSVLMAARSFVERLGRNDQISVVTYATEATIGVPLSRDTRRVAVEVGSLSILPESERGSTNTGEAFLRAYEELTSPRHNPNARKVFVLLTDGIATAPEFEPEVYATEMAALVKTTGIEVFTIGLGTKLNEPFLRSLATSEQHYFHAADRATINAMYERITDAICEEGAAKIEVFPKRQGSFTPLRP